jgi:ParB family chromosome partitioning protein
MVPSNRLFPNPDQPRDRFDQAALLELAESIKQQGILQPLLVEKRRDDGFDIVAGERRWRAGRLANIDEVPVIIREFSKEERLEIALIENVQREDLTPLEEARAYKHLMDTLGVSQQETADKVGKNRSTVANTLRLLNLPENMQRSLETGAITAGHARALLSVDDDTDRGRLHDLIVKKGLSVRESEKRAAGIKKPSEPVSETPSGRNPDMAEIEQKFIEALGTKVALRGSLSRGKVEISYFSGDDLDRIYQILSGRD